MLFSILIANYNNGHFFKDCYQSLIRQTYTNWEVIIVDDASTDNSVSVLEQLVLKDNRFKLFQNKENKGCGFTKRACVKFANGTIAGFVDPDDSIHLNALELMVNAHTEHPEVAIITSKYESVDIKMNFVSEGFHGSAIPSNKSYLTHGQGAMTHFATFKKEMYAKSEGISPVLKRAVDQDLYFNMEEQGPHLFLDKVLYKYRVHANSISQHDNLFKAHYWHFYAMRAAFIRRKRNGTHIDNFSSSDFKSYASNFYLGRFYRVKHTSKTKSKFYFISKAIMVNPFHRFLHKIKSLLLVILGRI
jgi:glycosyltransferase involved in cell wall biosynthesis